jgi:hypothetical protein
MKLWIRRLRDIYVGSSDVEAINVRGIFMSSGLIVGAEGSFDVANVLAGGVDEDTVVEVDDDVEAAVSTAGK